MQVLGNVYRDLAVIARDASLQIIHRIDAMVVEMLRQRVGVAAM